MKILQITAAVEEGVDNEATIFGLGDDNKPYYWGITETTVKEGAASDSKDPEDFVDVYGWIECGK